MTTKNSKRGFPTLNLQKVSWGWGKRKEVNLVFRLRRVRTVVTGKLPQPLTFVFFFPREAKARDLPFPPSFISFSTLMSPGEHLIRRGIRWKWRREPRPPRFPGGESDLSPPAPSTKP